jgi:polysaccharide export outer membrane protein
MQNISKVLLLAFLAGVYVPAYAAPTAQPAAPLGVTTASSDAYVIGSGDVVEVAVLGQPEFTTRMRVGVDGLIQLPFLGDVNAGSRTGRDLAEEVRKRLAAGGYYARPIVRVDVVSYASRYVIVLGAVGAPGLVPVDRAYRLSEILARVGGVRESAADYVVLRRGTGAEQRYPVEELASGGNDKDPIVSPDDKVYVPPAEQFFVSGQVKSPGAFALKAGTTFRMALARGGGVTDQGSEKRLKVTRKGVQLKAVKLDDLVQEDDVVVVGERLF